MPTTKLPPDLQVHPAAELFPLMTAEEFAALKQDIRHKGQKSIIVLFEGKILDGRNRYRACRELGFNPWMKHLEDDPPDLLKQALRGGPEGYVLSANLHRRHLSAEQKRAVIAQLLKADPKASNRSVAKRVKVDHKTVASVRAEAEGRGEIPHVETRTDSKGRGQPASKPSNVGNGRAEAPDFEHEDAGSDRATPSEVRAERKLAELRANATLPATSPLWQIIQGDCREVIPRLGEKPRLGFADFPFNQGIDYGDGSDADRLPDEQYLDRCRRCMQVTADAVAPDGSFWVLISDEFAAQFALMLEQVGLTRKQWIIWFESFGVCAAEKRGFARSSRHLFWYVKNPRSFVFNPDPVTRESWRLRNGDKRADPDGRTWDSVWGIDPPIPRLTGTCEERLPEFPTQLPVKLLLPIVGCASDPDDLVLDPFSGSATCGEAALKLGRRYVGIEKQSRFVELSRLRLRDPKRVTP